MDEWPALHGELYRVVTLMVSEHTAASTTSAHQRAHRPVLALVRCIMSCFDVIAFTI
jgi:hypothetical protein